MPAGILFQIKIEVQLFFAHCIPIFHEFNKAKKNAYFSFMNFRIEIMFPCNDF